MSLFGLWPKRENVYVNTERTGAVQSSMKFHSSTVCTVLSAVVDVPLTDRSLSAVFVCFGFFFGISGVARLSSDVGA